MDTLFSNGLLPFYFWALGGITLCLSAVWSVLGRYKKRSRCKDNFRYFILYTERSPNFAMAHRYASFDCNRYDVDY